MAITATSKGGDFQVDPIPDDNHLGRCIGMYDLGTQYNEKWKKSNREVVISFELPEVRLQFEKEDGEQVDTPRVVSKKYGLSLHKKSNLRKDLVGWRGKDFSAEEEKAFDITKVLGHPCMVTTLCKTVGTKNYTNIIGLGKPHKSIEFPEQELKSMSFSFEECESYEEVMKVINEDGFPEWIKNKIQESKEFKALKARAGVVDKPPSGVAETGPDSDPDDDDIPF